MDLPEAFDTLDPFSQTTLLWNNRNIPQLVQELPNGHGPIR